MITFEILKCEDLGDAFQILNGFLFLKPSTFKILVILFESIKYLAD